MAWVVVLVLVAMGARGEETTAGLSTPGEEAGTTTLPARTGETSTASEAALREAASSTGSTAGAEASTPRYLSTPDHGEYTRISSTVRPTEVTSEHTSLSTTERQRESTPDQHTMISSTASPADLREDTSTTGRPAESSPEHTASSTAPPEGISPDSRTDGPLTEQVTKSEVVVATSVRPVVAEPIRYATKPPRVVLATRPPFAALLKATTPPPAQAAVPQSSTSFTPPKQQQPSGTQIQRKGGIKIKKSKKKDNGMSSLIYIPIMIQAQLIPMMLMNLKFLALKALALGKLALLILGLNLLRNAMLGYDNDAEQYEHQTLASQHYGYNGGPEYGSWVNRRLHNPNNYSYRRNRFRPNIRSRLQDRNDINVRDSTNASNSKYLVVSARTDPATTVLNAFGNYPYRGHQNNILKEKKVTAEKAQ